MELPYQVIQLIVNPILNQNFGGPDLQVLPHPYTAKKIAIWKPIFEKEHEGVL